MDPPALLEDGSIIRLYHVTTDRRIHRIPRQGTWNGSVAGRVDCPVDWLGLVLDNEDVVLVLVRIKSDLLLLGARGVHVHVAVQVSALSVVVAEGNARTKRDICRDICHALVVEGGLELRGHE